MPGKLKPKHHASNDQSTTTLPTNWPKDIQFLTDHTYSPTITTDLRAPLSKPNESHAKILSEALIPPSKVVTIQQIPNPQHPACGQRGLFTSQHLEPDTFICLYLGHVHTNSLSDTDPHSDYDLSYDREIGISIDAAYSGNESRFANDYRGIAERPNAEFRDCFIQVKSEKRASGLKWERRVGIFVLSAGKAGKRKKGISCGEEVLVSYGKGFWEGRKMLAGFRKDEEMLSIATAALKFDEDGLSMKGSSACGQVVVGTDIVSNEVDLCSLAGPFHDQE